MPIFSKHKISLVELLGEIPESELTRLSVKTKVDYCTKVLYGKLMFYLLLYGMLCVDRLSQRGLRDAFSSPLFNLLFNQRGGREISHSSISERLNVINVNFFEEVYGILYNRFSPLYTEKEIAGMNLQRVDSTLVKECCNKLKDGLLFGQKSSPVKMLKYTFNFDGMFGCFVHVHKEATYANESIALPENVMSHFKQEKHHSKVYLFDRGMNSAEKFRDMKSEEGLYFVGRLIENRKLKHMKALDIEGVEFTYGKLVSDNICQLYKWVEVINKNGKISKISELVEEDFRVIRFRPDGKKEDILLITNITDLSADEIAEMYKRRWDIEVFFRFLKQELNFSHFISLSENGIRVILYMTLIAAMLVMIYKKENELGYKTAVRRMKIELEALVMAIIVIQSGGDIRKTDLPDP